MGVCPSPRNKKSWWIPEIITCGSQWIPEIITCGSRWILGNYCVGDSHRSSCATSQHCDLGTGIGQLATREQGQPARGMRTGPASMRHGNGESERAACE